MLEMVEHTLKISRFSDRCVNLSYISIVMMPSDESFIYDNSCNTGIGKTFCNFRKTRLFFVILFIDFLIVQMWSDHLSRNVT